MAGALIGIGKRNKKLNKAAIRAAKAQEAWERRMRCNLQL